MSERGLLVRPESDDDLDSPTALSGSLHEVEWNEVMRQLYHEGWTPVEDDDGLPMVDSETADGREVVTLDVRRRVIEQPALLQMEESFLELRRLADSTLKTA